MSPAFVDVQLNMLDMFVVANVMSHFPLHKKHSGLNMYETFWKCVFKITVVVRNKSAVALCCTLTPLLAQENSAKTTKWQISEGV